MPIVSRCQTNGFVLDGAWNGAVEILKFEIFRFGDCFGRVISRICEIIGVGSKGNKFLESC